MMRVWIGFGHHDRASGKSLAALCLVAEGFPDSCASVSTETLAARAKLLAVTAAHHHDGMLSRCHHLLTVCDRAPSSAAIASRDGQSSITARKDCMSRSIVRNVLSRNPYENTKIGLADTRQNVLSFPAMGHNISEADFLKAVTGRIKAAREDKGLSQTEMALILGIKQGTYHKYECRTIMPAHLMLKFCFHVGATPNDIHYGSLAASVERRAKLTKMRGSARGQRRRVV